MARKTLTAPESKTRTGEFFEALLMDGGVNITRNGRSFQLRLEDAEVGPKRTLGDALAMNFDGLESYNDWVFPKSELAGLKEIGFGK